MLSLSLNIQLSNIVNLLLGVVVGFFLMVMIACAILSKYLKKHNKIEQIREISNKAYTDHFLNDATTKDKIINSIKYEITEVSTLIHPNKIHPYYELSINDIIYGINHIQRKLKKIVSNPLCKDIKNIHINTLLKFEAKAIKPALKVSQNKVVGAFIMIFKVFLTIINLINPVFYIKKIMDFVISKRGKKDIVLISLDFIGNTTYEIYNREINLQNDNSNL